MTKGLARAIGGSILHSLLFRSMRYCWYRNDEKQHFHFVLAHPDDELAILKFLKVIANNPYLGASFTLISNGTQGYEPGMAKDRNEFGRLRVKEINSSLGSLGFNANVESLLDEREIYESLIDGNASCGRLIDMLQKAERHIAKEVVAKKADAVFVTDFAGGNIVHDIANFIVCSAARRIGFGHVIEFWQYFLDSPSNSVVVGDLGYDDRGRSLRESSKGKYDVEIPALGIHKGRAFLSLIDIIDALKHKKRFYASQEKTLNRLTHQTVLSYGVDAPRFREIDTCRMDHTVRPDHGVLYERAGWRLRGLERLPDFNDFKNLVQAYRFQVSY